LSERILLGPGPSMVSSRVMRAMAEPVLSHVDPDVLASLDAAVRRRLLTEFGIEIGAGLGPLAGKVWRVGLMGSSSSRSLLALLLGALEHILGETSHPTSRGSAVAAALQASG
jgi:aspartate aminotransferase-like enzyme